MPGTGPAGIPIGRALDVPAGIAYDDLRDVIAAVDRVHGVRSLPRIPVHFVRSMTDIGRFNYDYLLGQPISIAVRSDQAYRRITLLHEIGHFLDLCALGDGFDFGTLINPTLGKWVEAVTATRGYQDLVDLLRRRVASITIEGSLATDVLLTTDELEVLQRLVLPEELWARSYAQYVAARADRASLHADLVTIRIRRQGAVYYPVQWDDDDFVPIGVAFDELFFSLGWRQ